MSEDHSRPASADVSADPVLSVTIDERAPALDRERPVPVAAPIGLLVLVSTVQPTALNMHMPALARMQEDLATSTSAIQLTLSAYLAATAVGQIVVGPVSDIYGRRPVLLAGLMVFLIGTLICALAPTVDVLVAGRIVQAFGGCTGLVLSRAIVRDTHGSASAASMIGYVTMGMAIAPMMTPALGGVISEATSWRLVFAAMGLLGLAGLVLTAIRLKETHPATGTTHAFARFVREVGELAHVPAFWLFALTLCFLSVSFFAFVAGAVFVSQSVYGLSPAGYGLYFMFLPVGYIIGNFVTGRFGQRFGIIPLIVVGNILSLLGTIVSAVGALLLIHHPAALFAPMLLVAVGNGLSLPNALAGSVSVEPRLAGTASGFAGALQVGGGAVASVLVGLLSDAGIWPDSAWPVLMPMLVCGVVAVGLSFTLRPQMMR
ncbi:multidrug effflux MFS transporter [Acuticoccus mangrovi]|uniref:Bcr/CflA family efflux transporter n=1 Tax=Acuticoccus mangrovi TaxID=2796142 RepID=A0A934IL29_9HYPH|nr:multidrug effflux MFS transporter [Acuticoccus mangrovi]MBJ3774605.1 multidrug effflux MFS transporter [Acuticoccus mangrovi]